MNTTKRNTHLRNKKNNTKKNTAGKQRELLTLALVKQIGKKPFKAVTEIEGMSPDTNPYIYTLTGTLIIKTPINGDPDNLKTTKIPNWLTSGNNKTLNIKAQPAEGDPFYYLEAHYAPKNERAELQLCNRAGTIILGTEIIKSEMYRIPLR